MRLLSLTIRNFRSITRPSTFPLSSLSVLLGANNEGKSNVLLALELAMRTVLEPRRVSARPPEWFEGPRYTWERDFPVQLQGSQPAGRSAFLLEFELDTAECEHFRVEVGSRVKSPLPIEVTYGPDELPSVSIRKKGGGSRKVTEKKKLVAEFLSKRIDFDYIPAVRTAASALRVVERMVERELAPLESDPAYRAALERISELQAPYLKTISESLRGTLRQFLPRVRDVTVEVSSSRRQEALRRSTEIWVDDGVSTELRLKGDGVQSLAALALMRRTASSSQPAKHVVLALEEPESHLHPEGIHELRGVLQQLAATQQVVISTHCPLFVDRHTVERNVLVREGRAHPAKSLRDVRESLGVRASDNLQHAELVIVVEGNDDRIALEAVLRDRSVPLRSALEESRLAIDHIGGAGNLTYKLGLLRDAVCPYICFLDGDRAGREAAAHAKKDKVLEDGQVCYASLNHRSETEFEDLLDDGYVASHMLAKHAVRWGPFTPQVERKKWSDRAKEAFRVAGQPWDEAAVKESVALALRSSVVGAFPAHSLALLDNFIAVVCAALPVKGT